jgi:antitoxin ParD1/3/4
MCLDWHNLPITNQENKMPTRNVVLTQHQATVVEQLVSSGRYQNASEVLRDGLRLVEQREAEDASRLVALRSAVRVGMADFEQGHFKTFDSPDALGAHLSALALHAAAGA